MCLTIQAKGCPLLKNKRGGGGCLDVNDERVLYLKPRKKTSIP